MNNRDIFVQRGCLSTPLIILYWWSFGLMSPVGLTRWNMLWSMSLTWRSINLISRCAFRQNPFGPFMNIQLLSLSIDTLCILLYGLNWKIHIKIYKTMYCSQSVSWSTENLKRILTFLRQKWQNITGSNFFSVRIFIFGASDRWFHEINLNMLLWKLDISWTNWLIYQQKMRQNNFSAALKYFKASRLFVCVCIKTHITFSYLQFAPCFLRNSCFNLLEVIAWRSHI